ncbi:Amino acid racemase YgeA (RacX) (PDB:5ELL) [Commensalibacter communis]|uniref:Amino acid racemase YgeA (RacX) n=1 Tax=Commensalibacter communis TaxID=2972786 RepID=A0A9W4TM17_9PROT|nr:aspartate/glutamate racemase family protein [Commensalibacter communis]CAI3922273.1 Amino acid racemase YgeA (RacX) (PDB:5ELL) [Commensalibacter communis]CAI3933993.1 Amino acid racemase YgeA (RacX) (PDB:5ELL) [Commensalibacter communis]CAI3943655.1 Amino acid racemase YgeA (RacX) (PDB:5ELL) [Commensalibacter communis]CAI3950882.1 Amino acid racemase YgeA (RacX) (PDB:5ELL) [Commensalibacter communis]CAI3952502.1 Amino acid racemase YgeA (RacX) (PDB:5ELL) [Commensalibacter communis]
MKTIGLLGGMSWESTGMYYQLINQKIKARLGGLHSAKITLFSVDFAEIESLQRQGKWDEAGIYLAEAARKIEAGGADFLLICTNTMHKVAEQIQNAISIPVLHIVDAVAESLKENNIKKIGLLGTQFTMEDDFYKSYFFNHHHIETIIPSLPQREKIHHIIYNELCLGQINAASKQYYLETIQDLYDHGAEAIVLGCTEIQLLIQQQDTDVPLYDTTLLHAEYAVDYALNKV